MNCKDRWTEDKRSHGHALCDGQGGFCQHNPTGMEIESATRWECGSAMGVEPRRIYPDGTDVKGGGGITMH